MLISIEEETQVTPFQNQSPTLTYDVFALKRPGLTRDVPPGTESLLWTANTATLIAGSQDAVLGDTFATIDQNRQLVDWMKKSRKNLTTIYISLLGPPRNFTTLSPKINGQRKEQAGAGHR